MRSKKLEKMWQDLTCQPVWICKNSNGLRMPGEKIPKSHYIVQKIINGEVINHFSNLKEIEFFLKEIEKNKNYFL